MARHVTQDRVSIEVSSMPGPWMTSTGNEAERENVKMRPGSGLPKVIVHTALNYGDLTLSRMFDADRDAALLAKLNADEPFVDTVITETYKDSDGNAIPGAKSVHTGCVVASFKGPDGDANSSDPGELTVTWSRAGAA